MMKKRHILHWAMGVILTPLLGSCAADDVVGGAGREECDIISGQPMTVTSATKATDGRTSSTQFEKDEIVWLWANKTDGNEYIKAWKLTAQDGGTFTGTNTNKYWPSDGKSLNVYALHGNFKNTTISEDATSWSSLSLTHTVMDDQTSDDNKRLSDLLYSHKSSVAPNNTVQLTFDHLLAKITVKLDLDNSKGIKAPDLSNATVKLTNIQPEATISNTLLTGNSEKTNTKGTHTTITAGKITSSISSGDVIGSAIVPLQNFGGGKSDASQNNVITITLASPDNRSFSYKPETNVALSAGKEYTYTLRIIGNKITGSLSVSDFISATESISFKDYFDYLADLKNRNCLGSSGAPHDLSYDYNGQMNTANCYVVTHPGYYKFPLVYGNAIKNGATNAIAYGVGTNSTTFVNHLDQPITDPYIYNNKDDNENNLVANSAELVWQDAQNLISNISLCDDKKYIKFEITKENIEQGNAVIAVKHTDGTIMWSWHIWVTNKNVYETYTYGDYKFMPIALGQRETAQGTTCTYYQWGRKDPFPGATADGQATENMSLQTYYSSIKNPGNFFNGTTSSLYFYDWFNSNLRDLWNVGNTSIANNTATSKKTIYDPSPVGFKVPPPAAFTAIGLSTAYWNSTSGNEGISVPATGDFWRAFGCRLWDSGSSSGVGTSGRYWSCGPYEIGTNRVGWHLYFLSSGAYPQSYDYARAYGSSVRPVSE